MIQTTFQLLMRKRSYCREYFSEYFLKFKRFCSQIPLTRSPVCPIAPWRVSWQSHDLAKAVAHFWRQNKSFQAEKVTQKDCFNLPLKISKARDAEEVQYSGTSNMETKRSSWGLMRGADWHRPAEEEEDDALSLQRSCLWVKLQISTMKLKGLKPRPLLSETVHSWIKKKKNQINPTEITVFKTNSGLSYIYNHIYNSYSMYKVTFWIAKAQSLKINTEMATLQ